MMILKCQNYEITIRMAPELTADEAVGQSLRLCIIKHQVCIETSEYFMYDPKGSSPCSVCRCVSSQMLLSQDCLT